MPRGASWLDSVRATAESGVLLTLYALDVAILKIGGDRGGQHHRASLAQER
jgi:hypothetical protein